MQNMSIKKGDVTTSIDSIVYINITKSQRVSEKWNLIQNVTLCLGACNFGTYLLFANTL